MTIDRVMRHILSQEPMTPDYRKDHGASDGPCPGWTFNLKRRLGIDNTNILQQHEAHQESLQQGQERLLNAKQRVEVIPVQRQHQAKTVPELRTFFPTIRRMTECDRNKLSTFHTNLGRIQRNILTRDHFQPRRTAWAPSSCKGDGDGWDM